MRYLNNHDVRMRLHSTYCMYKDTPVLVKIHDGESTKVDLYDLKHGERITVIDANDEALDIESLPLGYVNLGRAAAYTVRMPYRQQKQGVSHENSFYYIDTWDVDGNRGRNGLGALDSPILYRMFQNEYPSFSDVLKDMHDNYHTESSAFHRRLALVGQPKTKNRSVFQIRFCSKTMGFYLSKSDKALIAESFDDFTFRNLLAKLGIHHEVLPSLSRHVSE